MQLLLQKLSILVLLSSVLLGCYMTAEVSDTSSEISKNQTVLVSPDSLELSLNEGNADIVYSSSLKLTLNQKTNISE